MYEKYVPKNPLRCGRCGKKGLSFTFVSIFDSKNICDDCETIENNHPRMREAVEFVKRSKNPRECKGIGWPPPVD